MADNRAKPTDPVLLGVIGAPHGIRGEVRVKSFTGDPEALGDYGPLWSADGRRFSVEAIRQAKGVVVVRFAEIGDRNAAEGANGTELFVDRSALPSDLDEDEFYVADLVGMKVEDDADTPLGTVTAVHDFGGGDILEIGSGRRSIMVPFTKAAVPQIDFSGRRIVVDRVAAAWCLTRTSRIRYRRAWTPGPMCRTASHELPRHCPDALSGDVSGSLGLSLPERRSSAETGRWSGADPGLRYRTPQGRGRHAGRRRSRHGAAS